mgnify:CR=1 FL=1|jgi:hypothetical protein
MNEQSCIHCVDTQVTGYIFCRHSEVMSPATLLPQAVCRVCPKRNTPCDNPKPVPDAADLTQNTVQQVPGILRQTWDLLVSLKDFVADGMATVSSEEYETRLRICDTCEFRKMNRCIKCGCHLSIKARGRAFKCPAGYWEGKMP